MSFDRQSAHTRGFYGVALLLIVLGSGIFAIGGVEWIGNLMGNWEFSWPLSKVVSGLIVLALGYIVLELELVRTK